MRKLRISVVEFLNTAPLVWGFTDGPLAGKYDLSFTMPSQCAEALRQGDADVAIIPAIEYQRIENIVALPGMAVAAKGEVRSILVVAKKPIEMAKRTALDAAREVRLRLVRLLAASLWKIQPELMKPHPALPKCWCRCGFDHRRPCIAYCAQIGCSCGQKLRAARNAARAIRTTCPCQVSKQYLSMMWPISGRRSRGNRVCWRFGRGRRCDHAWNLLLILRRQRSMA